MINKIAVLPGDGIGPDVMFEALKVLDIISEKLCSCFNFSTKFLSAFFCCHFLPETEIIL